MKPGPASQTGSEELLYLLGRPPFKDYLHFVTTQTVDTANVDQKKAADEWRVANDLVLELERTEPDWADNPPIQPVSANLKGRTAEVMATPLFQKAFAFVPVEVGIVELDRLVVTQKTINLTHVRRITQQLDKALREDKLFDFCLPSEQTTAGARVARIPNGFVFLSEANDLRFLESTIIKADQLTAYQAVGPVAGVVGLVVGFSSNYLNVVSAEGRLVLNNGYHRVYAMRERGVTHAPFVIQRVTRREELEMVGTGALKRTPDAFLQQPRPSVVKDYFEARMRKVLPVMPKARQVRITYTIEEFNVPGSG